MVTPVFPPPDPRDPPAVAATLRTAAALWNAGRHREAIPHLIKAAPLAASAGAPRDRVMFLAKAATEIATFVEGGDDPRSIPISLDFDVASVNLESVAIEILAPPKKPPPRQRKGTMPEEFRPQPDTVRVDPEAQRIPPPKTLDLTETVPQGTKPSGPPKPYVWPTRPQRKAPSAPKIPRVLAPDVNSAQTKRMEDIPTERSPSQDEKKRR